MSRALAIVWGLTVGCLFCNVLAAVDFEPAVPVASVLWVHHTFVVNMDGGLVDFIATEGASGNVTWHRNQGGLAFERHVITSNAASINPISSAAYDFNGDGSQDVLVTFPSGEVGYFMSVPSAGPPPVSPVGWAPQTLSMSNHLMPTTNPVIVQLADMTRDGRMDAVVVGYSPLAVLLFVGNSSGGFQERRVANGSVATINALALVAMHTPGTLDIVYGEYESGLVGVLRNNGSGWFPDPPTVLTRAALAVHSVLITDITGDGTADFCFAANPNWVLTCSHGVPGSSPLAFGAARNITTTLGRGTAFGQPFVDAGIVFIEAADIVPDSAHTVDLATAYFASGTVVVFVGAGGSAFASNITISGVTGAHCVRVVDLDGDGMLDLLSSAFFADAVLAHRAVGRCVPVTCGAGLAVNASAPAPVCQANGLWLPEPKCVPLPSPPSPPATPPVLPLSARRDLLASRPGLSVGLLALYLLLLAVIVAAMMVARCRRTAAARVAAAPSAWARLSLGRSLLVAHPALGLCPWQRSLAAPLAARALRLVATAAAAVCLAGCAPLLRPHQYRTGAGQTLPWDDALLCGAVLLVLSEAVLGPAIGMLADSQAASVRKLSTVAAGGAAGVLSAAAAVVLWLPRGMLSGYDSGTLVRSLMAAGADLGALLVVGAPLVAAFRYLVFAHTHVRVESLTAKGNQIAPAEEE